MSHKYRITLFTGDVNDAGTDAEVFITLNGSHGHTGEIILDNPGIDDRERGSIDTHHIEVFEDIGDLSSVRIRHDNSGNKPGWFLDKITVTNESKGSTWECWCNQWLATSEGDGKIDRFLTARKVKSRA